MALTAFPLTCMDTQNDSYTRLRKCKKCGSGTRFNRAPLPTDACSSCGAIYAKVEEALDADPVEPGDQPLSGWVLFMLVTVAVTLCGAAVAPPGLARRILSSPPARVLVLGFILLLMMG
jgi:uncharacterized protein (DUF983 family)